MTDEQDAPIPGGLQADLRSPDPETRRLALLTLAEVKKDRKLLKVFIEVSQTDADPDLRTLALSLAERYVDDVSGPIEIPKTGIRSVLLPAPDGDGAAPPRPVTASAQPAVPGTLSRPARPPPSLEEILSSAETVPRIEAIRRVTEARDTSQLPLLRRRLESEKDLWVAATLLKAVGQLGGSEDINLIQRFLKHDDLRVQANAIEALELIGDELSFALVTPMLGSEDPRIRSNAIRCLMRFDPDEAFETLGRMARSEQAANRDSALYCMGLIQHRGIPALLLEMVATESEERLLSKEIALLGEEGDREAVGALASLRDQQGPELSRLAAGALSRSLERLQVTPEEVPGLKLEWEARQLAAGRLAGGPGGLPGDESGPDLPPLRSSQGLPLEASGSQHPAEAPRVPEELPRNLAEELAGLGRKKKGKEDVPPPTPMEQVKRFARENPGAVALFGFTLVFLTGTALIFVTNLSLDAGPPTTLAPITVKPRDPRPATTAPTEVVREDLVTLDCVVDHVDRRRKTALLKRDDELILALLDKSPPEEINKGDAVTVRGHYTGKERFGAKYFKAVEFKER